MYVRAEEVILGCVFSDFIYRRIHFLKAVDLWRLQNIQSWQHLQEQRKKRTHKIIVPLLTSWFIVYKHHISPLFSHYVVMFEEAQHPQLSEDPFAGHQVLEDIRHLLQSHFSTVTGISNWPVRDGQSHFRHIGLKKHIFLWKLVLWHTLADWVI